MADQNANPAHPSVDDQTFVVVTINGLNGPWDFGGYNLAGHKAAQAHRRTGHTDRNPGPQFLGLGPN